MDRFRRYSALAIDDDIDSLESMCEYLSIEFYIVYKATNTQDALDTILYKKPDIIFTDIQMPENDGFSLIEQLKQHNKKIPIVIISAYDDKDKLFKAIKADIVDYLIKPLTSKKLKESMKLCFRRLEFSTKLIDLKDGFSWSQKKSFLFKNDRPIKLTKSETKLIQMLVENLNTPVESIDLFYYLWGYEQKEFSSKNIRNTIYKVRKKIESASLIENIYGSKYIISSNL